MCRRRANMSINNPSCPKIRPLHSRRARHMRAERWHPHFPGEVIPALVPMMCANGEIQPLIDIRGTVASAAVGHCQSNEGFKEVMKMVIANHADFVFEALTALLAPQQACKT